MAGLKETVQGTPLGMRYMWKTLAGLRVLLGSRESGNDVGGGSATSVARFVVGAKPTTQV